MAGIGFELRSMIDQRQGFVAKVRAYACAGLISSGPWLMTILTLTLLNLAAPYLGGNSDFSMFRALVTYSFAFSLIIVGAGQMAFTRRVADLLYSHKYERVLPAFAATMLITGLVHAAIGTAFTYAAGFTPALACVAVSLFTIIGMTWLALIWLSVTRQYDDVLRAYIYGTLVAMAGMVLLSLDNAVVGILGAYTAGQAFTLMLLVRTILRGMESGGGRDFGIFGSLFQFPRLVLFGLFYNVAIWVDKMVFWFGDGVGPHPWVQYHPLYDTCSFLAYLTVVPALAVNLIRLETSFYEHYRAYYSAILGGTPLSVIEDKRQRMFENMRESTIRLIRVQGAITIAVIIFAPVIIKFLELPEIGTRVFRLTCLGAFFHVLLLTTVLMQLYFDLRKQAMATAAIFLLLNGGLAWWSVGRGIETYGIGYSIASFLSLLLGYTLLHRALERLDYLTFTNQPIGDDDDLPAPEDDDAADEEDEKVTIVPTAPDRVVIYPEEQEQPEEEEEQVPPTVTEASDLVTEESTEPE